MDILKRFIAPITEEAWQEIDEEAVRTLKTCLSARTIVDFQGPLGWTSGAVNLGRLEIPKKQAIKGVHWGKRKVQPLMEVRVPFFLDQMEIDSISRGSKDADLGALSEAAQTAAHFEETVIYNGFSQGEVKGIFEVSPHEPLNLSCKPEDCVKGIEEGVKNLQSAGIGGPYALVLGTEPYHILKQSVRGGYPLRKIIRDLLEGELLWSPAIEGGGLISKRGGDFELTIGQDLSIGYASHDRERIELYFTETFTFRILEPAAAVAYTFQA